MNAPNHTQAGTAQAQQFDPKTHPLLRLDGAKDTRAPYLSSGAENQSSKARDDYGTITHTQIDSMIDNPTWLDKQSAIGVIPSDYVGCYGRSHNTQKAEGRFFYLALDIDTASPGPEAMIEMVREICAHNVLCIAYTTSSATADNPKCRVLILLKSGISGRLYGPTQQALFEAIRAKGVEPDATLARPGQPIYLPNVPSEMRDEAGVPKYYRAFRSGTEPLDLQPSGVNHPLLACARVIAAEEAAQEQRTKAAALARTAKEKIAQGKVDNDSVIEWFEKNNSAEDMMRRHGWTQHGQFWHCPEQTTNSPANLHNPEKGPKIVSFSGTVQSWDVGIDTPSGKILGSLDLYAHYEHGDDIKAAVRDLDAQMRAAAETEDTVPAEDDAYFQQLLANITATQAAANAGTVPEATEKPTAPGMPTTAAVATEPTPLIGERQEPTPFPMESLGVLRDVAEAVAWGNEAPKALAAHCALAASNAAVMGLANAQLLSGPPIAINLYLLGIGASGERKSRCDGDLQRRFKEIVDARREKQASKIAEWQREYDVWKLQHDALRNSVKKDPFCEAAAKELKAHPPAPVQPYVGEAILGNPTIEAVAARFKEDMPTQTLICDEALKVFGGHSMRDEARSYTLGNLNNFWDASDTRIERVSTGTIVLKGKRLGMNILGQPKVVRDFLSDEVAEDSGNLARFLISEPASTMGTRLNPKRTVPKEPLDRFNKMIERAMAQELPMNENRELMPVPLGHTAESAAALEAYSIEVEKQLAEGGRLRSVKGSAAKSAEQAVRIAATLTLIENPYAKDVGGTAMTNGIELARYYLDETLRLRNEGAPSAAILEAEALRVWLVERRPIQAKQNGWEPNITHSREICRSGPTQVRDAEACKRAMATLEKYGWVVRLPEGTSVSGGAKKHCWTINAADAK